MNKLIKEVFLCLLALVLFCANDGTAQTLSGYDLVGKVKRFRLYHYTPLDDCDYCEEIQCDSTLVEFNVNGKVVREIFYTCSFLKSEEGKVLTEKCNYKYNSKGKLVEKDITEAWGDNYKEKIIRDDRGFIIRIEKYYINTKESSQELRSIEYRKNSEDGTIQETSNYKYYNSKKTLCWRDYYDETGFLTKTIYYDLEGNEKSEETFSRERYPSGITSKRTALLSNGLKEVVLLNEKGLVTTCTKYREDGTIYSTEKYTYKYDNFGNWIYKKKVTKVLTFKETVDIIKCIISYYR